MEVHCHNENFQPCSFFCVRQRFYFFRRPLYIKAIYDTIILSTLLLLFHLGAYQSFLLEHIRTRCQHSSHPSPRPIAISMIKAPVSPMILCISGEGKKY